MKPTYEQLEHELKNARKKIDKIEALLQKALGRIDKLEEQLKIDSRNSSKAPSSDQKKNKGPPKKGGARSGHQGPLGG